MSSTIEVDYSILNQETAENTASCINTSKELVTDDKEIKMIARKKRIKYRVKNTIKSKQLSCYCLQCLSDDIFLFLSLLQRKKCIDMKLFII